MLLFHFPWNLLIASFITHKYLSTKYPVSYKNFYLNLVYYSINFYSKAQILYLKIKPRFLPFIKPFLPIELFKYFSLVNNEKEDFENLEFVKDGKVIFYCSKNKLNESEVPTTFDFILYSSLNDKSSEIINKKMLFHFPLNIEDFNIEKTNYILTLTEIKLEEQETPIKLDLISQKYNYFIENNKINSSFLAYFLNKYYDCKLSSNNFVIKIIDENINIHSVNGATLEEVCLNKNNFKIIQNPNYLPIMDSFHDKKISDSICFSKSFSETDLEYDDLPTLISSEPDLDLIESFSFI